MWLHGLCGTVVVTAEGLKQGAYMGDTTLTEAVVPAEVDNLPLQAFAYCKNLQMIRFEDNSKLRDIGEYAFYECSSLKELKLPSGVVAVPKYMCAWCENIERVDLPAGLRDIGQHAFAYCGKLKKINIPDGVKHLGSNVFSLCSNLEEIFLPDSIKELESYAFSDCTSLKKIVMPSNGDLLGELILSGCYALEEIVEKSLTVPDFDCHSSLFEPDETAMYGKCILKVAKGMCEAYRNAPGWSLFRRIEEKE